MAPPQHQMKALPVGGVPIGQSHTVAAYVISRRERVAFAFDQAGFGKLFQPPVLRLQGDVINGSRHGIAVGRGIDRSDDDSVRLQMVADVIDKGRKLFRWYVFQDFPRSDAMKCHSFSRSIEYAKS